MALLGGYENELVEPPQELQWECSICLQIVREPRMVSCCGLRYCRSCIEQIQRRGNPCPHCQQRFAQVVPDAQLERKLMFKRVYCIKKNAGCQWVGGLKEAEKHVRVGCMWAEVACPNKCGQHFLRCRLNQHATEECPRHPRLCEFADRGCNSEALTPDGLQDHMQRSVHKHLTLVCQALEDICEGRKVKAMVQSHQAKVQELEGKVQDCETTMKQLEVEVNIRDTTLQNSEAMVKDGKARVAKLEVMKKVLNVVLLPLAAILSFIIVAKRQHIYEQYIFTRDWCYEALSSIFWSLIAVILTTFYIIGNILLDIVYNIGNTLLDIVYIIGNILLNILAVILSCICFVACVQVMIEDSKKKRS